MKRDDIARCVGAIVLMLWGLLLLSCDGGVKVGGRTKVGTMTGTTNQLLIVGAGEVGQSEIADTLNVLFTQDYPYLPQAEPLFDVVFTPPKSFTGVLRYFRNVLLVDVMPDSGAVSYALYPDIWAEGQRVMRLCGPSKAELARYVHENRDAVLAPFVGAERARMDEALRKGVSKPLQAIARERVGVALAIPSTMALRTDTTDFCWISGETSEISQGVLLYRFPYRGARSLSRDSLVAHRNRLTKLWLPGPTEGTYVTISEFIEPSEELIMRKGDSLLRCRGLWDMQGHPMGGGFVAIAHHDPEWVYVREAFLYAPGKKKRNLMLQLEGILLSD